MSDLFNGLANLTKQVTSNISTYEIRKIREKVEGMVLNYTEEETLVREATNEDPWGPTGQQMKDITHLSFQYDGFSKVMPMIWKRMFEDNRQAWRRVYKSLTLLDYLLHNGSERVINSSRDHMYQLRALENYKFTDEKGRDQGLNIRHRCAKILELLNDEDKLRNERKRAKDENKEKYQGYNSDDVRLKAQGMSFSGSDSSASPQRRAYSSNDRDDYSNKEVNSFSFPEDNRQSCEAVEEDDDFESFAQSRSSASPKPPVTNKNTNFGISSPAVSPFKISPVPKETGKTFDLLGFDSNTDTPTPVVAAPNKLIDIFNSTGQQSETQYASVPRPPSNGPGSTPAGNQHSSNAAQEVDLLGGFSVSQNDNNSTSGVAFPTSSDSNDWFAAAKQPANDDFADFASFQTAGTAMSTTSQEPALAPQLIPASLDFGSGWTNSTEKKDDNTMEGVNKGLQSPNAPKVGNTWTGADSDLFNLDNLGMKTNSSAKTNVSMNEMQRNKKW